MKTLFFMIILAVNLTACSHEKLSMKTRKVASFSEEIGNKCSDNFPIYGRDPYGDTAAESITNDFEPRMKEVFGHCLVQKEMESLAAGNSIEVTGFEVQGLMAEIKFNIQDFKKHTKIKCTMQAGMGTDNERVPSGPGPIAPVGYLKQIVTKPMCEAPVRS